jgi:hypothetical protein
MFSLLLFYVCEYLVSEAVDVLHCGTWVQVN